MTLTMNQATKKIAVIALFLVGSYAYAEEQYAKADAETAPKVNLANGEKNWILIDGVTRDHKTLTFPEVHVEGNSWLVMHPFEGGKPNGDKYVAASYVESGTNKAVEIKVHKGVETGDMFIVMLHRDVNENKVLDFVFTSDTGVMDEAVFEGTTMVAHVISAP